jgi:hypothetical protein
MSATYLAYIVFWEAMIWGGAFYAVVVRGYSGWLWLLAVIMSQAAYPPEKWAALLR